MQLTHVFTHVVLCGAGDTLTTAHGLHTARSVLSGPCLLLKKGEEGGKGGVSLFSGGCDGSILS